MKYAWTLRGWRWLVLGMLWVAAGEAKAQAPTWAWAVSPGGGEHIRTVADAAGNVYLTGRTNDTLQFGTTLLTGGQVFMFVAKYSPNGVAQWGVKVDGSLIPRALAVDGSGNVYLTGDMYAASATFGATTLTNAAPGVGSSDLFVAMINPTGSWQWARSVGNSYSESGRGLAIDNSGNVIVTGEFTGYSVSFGTTTLRNSNQFSPNYDVFVAKLSPTGVWQWAVSAGGPSVGGGDHSESVGLDAGGNVYVAGYCTDSVATFGTLTLTGHYHDAFVAKLNPTGDWQWVRGAGGLRGEFADGIAVSGAGDVYLTGRYDSPAATFGAFSLSSPGESRAYVAKLNSAGVWQWATGSRGTIHPQGGIVLDGAGNTYSSGLFSTRSADFGSHTLTNTGYQACYVARCSPAGSWQWAVSAGGYAGGAQILGMNLMGPDDICVSGIYERATATFGTTVLPTLPNRLQQAAFLARLGAHGVGLPEDAPPTPLTLTPNPAHHTVRLTGTTAPTATLLDALGRTVREWPLAASGELDLRGLAPGLYTVRAGTAARRLVVE